MVPGGAQGGLVGAPVVVDGISVQVRGIGRATGCHLQQEIPIEKEEVSLLFRLAFVALHMKEQCVPGW